MPSGMLTDKTHYNLEKEKILVPQDIPSKIGYTRKSQNKQLQDFIKKVNDDQKKFAEKVGTLIQRLQEYSRQNDANLLVNVFESLKKISNETLTSSDIDTSKFKKTYIVNKIKALNTLTDEQKTTLQKTIEKLFDGKGRDDLKKQFDTELDKQIRKPTNQKQDVKLDKKNTIKLYKSILKNETFIKTLTKKYSLFITNVALEEDKKKFQNLISSFKKKHNTIFGHPNQGVISRTSFSQMILRGAMGGLFVIKYNKRVYSTFKDKLANLDAKSWDEVRNNAMPNIIKSEITKSLKKWWNSKKKISKLFTVKFWKEKFGKLKDSVFNFFELVGAKNVIFGTLNVASSCILAAGNFLFKTALFGVKLGFNILKGIYGITTKIIGGAITILKGILKTTLKIISVITGTAHTILKKVKAFLLTPFGAYAVGFIVGFLKQKIKEWALESYEWIKKKIKDVYSWFKKKDARWSLEIETEETVDEYGNIVYLPKKNFYRRTKDKILHIINAFRSIFSDDDPNNWDQIKKMLDEPKKDKDGNKQGKTYSETIIGLEQWFIDTYKWVRDNIGTGRLMSEIQTFYDKVKNSSIMVQLSNMLTLTGTGVPSAKLAAGITNSVVSTAITAGGAIVGAGLQFVFPFVGPAIAGVVTGVLNKIVTCGISRAFVIKTHKATEVLATKNVLESINKRYNIGAFQVKKASFTHISDVQNKLNSLKSQLEKETDEGKKQQIQKQINDENEKLRLFSTYNNDTILQMQNRINGISDNIMVGNDINSLIDYQTGENIFDDLKSKEFKIAQIVDKTKKGIENHYKAQFKDASIAKQQFQYNTKPMVDNVGLILEKIISKSASIKRFLMNKYAYKYNNGSYGLKGSKEAIDKYKQEVKQEYSNIFENELLPVGKLPLGRIIQNPEGSGIELFNIIQEIQENRVKTTDFTRLHFGSNGAAEVFIRDLNGGRILDSINLYLNNKEQEVFGGITDIDKFATDKALEFRDSLKDKKDIAIVSRYFDLFRRYAFENDENNTKYHELLEQIKKTIIPTYTLEEQSKTEMPEALEYHSSNFGKFVRKINGFLLPSNISEEKLEALYSSIEMDEVDDKTKEEYDNARKEFENKAARQTKLIELYSDIKNDERHVLEMSTNQTPPTDMGTSAKSASDESKYK